EPATWCVPRAPRLRAPRSSLFSIPYSPFPAAQGAAHETRPPRHAGGARHGARTGAAGAAEPLRRRHPATGRGRGRGAIAAAAPGAGDPRQELRELRGKLHGALAREVNEFIDAHSLLLDDAELL